VAPIREFLKKMALHPPILASWINGYELMKWEEDMTSVQREELKKKHCRPCEGGTKPLSRQESDRLIAEIDGWKVSADGKSIQRNWSAEDFDAAMEFVDSVAKVAESEDHHPDLHLTGYRNVAIELSTHAIKGLSENDFILAAKINDLPIRLKKR